MGRRIGVNSPFDLERLNELEFLDATLPAAEQGFRTVLVTEADQSYIAA